MPHASAISIGKLARLADVKIPTIRFYEQIGLLPEPDRTESARRVYGEAAVRRLAFIRHARQLGFSVDAIRSLLALTDDPDRSCEEANALAAAQLADVEQKITRLEALRGELRRMAAAGCQGRAGDCRVIEALNR
ncbi:MAG: MerR family transcriptional regulator [Phenylobacterium sp.]